MSNTSVKCALPRDAVFQVGPWLATSCLTIGLFPAGYAAGNLRLALQRQCVPGRFGCEFFRSRPLAVIWNRQNVFWSRGDVTLIVLSMCIISAGISQVGVVVRRLVRLLAASSFCGGFVGPSCVCLSLHSHSHSGTSTHAHRPKRTL